LIAELVVLNPDGADANDFARAFGFRVECGQAEETAQKSWNECLLVTANGEVDETITGITQTAVPKLVINRDKRGLLQFSEKSRNALIVYVLPRTQVCHPARSHPPLDDLEHCTLTDHFVYDDLHYAARFRPLSYSLRNVSLASDRASRIASRLTVGHSCVASSTDIP
jgi:hypothetical protein